MKTRQLTMGIAAMLCSLLGCTAQTKGFRSIGVEEFEKAIADTAKVIRLDVRTAEEFAEGHIAGAYNIDVQSGDFDSKTVGMLPKSGKTIAVYCRSGRRSKKAAGILAGQGFDVIELDSGFLGWAGAGKPVVKE